MPYLTIRTLVSALQSQRALAVENLALRHQRPVLQRSAKKRRLRRMDRFLRVLLSRVWIGRKVVHSNVAETPPAWWTGRQIIEAFSLDTAPNPHCVEGVQSA